MKLRRKPVFDEEEGAINVSPLIDVVFILLIFFIVSATFISLPGVDISKPKVQTASALKKNSVLFALSNQNEIFYSGVKVKLSQVSALISEAIINKDKPVVIQVDKSADAILLSKLVSAAKKSSHSVSLATLKNE